MNDASKDVEFPLGFLCRVRDTKWIGHEKYTLVLLLLPPISFSTEDTNK